VATAWFSGTNLAATNGASWGSVTTVIRTHGASNGATTTVPPSSEAFFAILVDRQWNAKTRAFTLPKHGHVRTIALTPTRARLLALPRESEYVFTTLRGSHYRPSSRAHHWNRVRCTAGLADVDFYLATRHYFCWYACNVLRLTPEDAADQLGHRDGGKLVRELYGHLGGAPARERIREAFEHAPELPIPLRATG
jgi:hypothetical protein